MQFVDGIVKILRAEEYRSIKDEIKT